jgi:copper transport protein
MTGLRSLRVASLAGVIGLLLASVATPGPVAAHALLRSSVPGAGATLGSAPATVSITFSEAPDVRLTSIKVLDSAGADHASGPPEAVAGDEASVTVPVGDMPDGGYTVSWRTVSSVDGHLSAGSFVFGVGEPPPTSGPSGPVATAGLTGSPAAIVARWLLYVGLVVLFGAAWVAVAIARRPEPALLAMAAAGWVLTALGTIGVVAVQWAEADAPIETLLTTSLGLAALVRAGSMLLVGLALSALAVVPALAGRRGWSLTAIAAAAALVADVALGHAAAGPSWPLQVLAQSAHAIAAAAWLGGLAGLLLVIRGTSAEDRLTLARRYSSWAGLMLAVVVATGVVRAVAELGSVDALLGTDVGRTIIAKSGVLAVLAAIGAFNRYVTLGNAARVSRWLGRAGAAEIGLAAIVLGLSALLVNQSPPAAAPGTEGPTARPLVVTGHDFGTSIRARLVITSGAPGTNTFELAVTDYDTGASVDAAGASLRFEVKSVAGVAPATLDLARSDAGTFTGSGAQLSIDGIWTVTATVTQSGSAVEVPMLVATVVPEQPVDALVTEGLPTIYTVQVGAAGSVQVYLDPGNGGPAQLHVTFFDAAGSERPVDAVTVAAFTGDGAGELLAPRLLEPGHFVTSIVAGAGPLVVDAVTGDLTGAGVSHIHVHVTIEVQP